MMMINKILKVNESAKIAEVGNEIYIMHKGEYYVLNDTAKQIWDYIMKGTYIVDIPELLYKFYDGKQDFYVIKKDCDELIESLIVEEILVEKA